MSSKKGTEAEAFALVFPIGRTDGEFFTNAKMCLSHIIERKLVTKSVDHICLVLTGSHGSYETTSHLSFPFALQRATWDMLKFVHDLKSTEHDSDWLDGVVVAMDKLYDSPFPTKRIVLFSDFAAQISTSEVNLVICSLRDKDFGLTVIGPRHFHNVICDEDDCPEPKRLKLDESLSAIDVSSVKLIQHMHKELGDRLEVSTFEQALRLLSKPPTLPMKKGKPCNYVMDIGDVNIKVSAYVKVDSTVKRPNTRTHEELVAENEANKEMDLPPGPPKEKLPPPPFTQTLTREDIEREKQFEKPEKVKMQKYGNTMVQLSASDKEAMFFKSGKKCLSVIAFIPYEDFDWMYLTGKGCHVITPVKDDPEAAIALSALVQAMKKEKRGALARRVYRQDSMVNLVLLSPVVEEAADQDRCKEYLVMNELAWKEGIKKDAISQIPVDLKEEQLKAIDDLIDSMDLMTADRDESGQPVEAFNVSDLYEQKNTFYIQCLINRGLDKPLPKKSSVTLSDLSWQNEDQIKANFKKIQELFPITLKETPKERHERWHKQKQELLKQRQEQEPPSAQILLDYPKPIINEQEDVESVKHLKTLFIEYAFPPVRAIIRTLKNHLMTGGVNTDMVWPCFEQCVVSIRDYASTAASSKYNEWLDELMKNSPDVSGIYSNIASLAAGSCAMLPSKTCTAGKLEEFEETDDQTQPKDAMDLEKHQLLEDLY